MVRKIVKYYLRPDVYIIKRNSKRGKLRFCLEPFSLIRSERGGGGGGGGGR